MSKFELQKSTNAAFGTRNFNYELIFMLFDRDERDVELKAKEIQKRWFLIKVDYVQKKITARLTVNQINYLAIGFFILYVIVAIMMLVIVAGYYWIPLKGVNESVVMLILFLIIFICAYAFLVLGSVKSLETLMDR